MEYVAPVGTVWMSMIGMMAQDLGIQQLETVIELLWIDLELELYFIETKPGQLEKGGYDPWF